MDQPTETIRRMVLYAYCTGSGVFAPALMLDASPANTSYLQNNCNKFKK